MKNAIKVTDFVPVETRFKVTLTDKQFALLQAKDMKATFQGTFVDVLTNIPGVYDVAYGAFGTNIFFTLLKDFDTIHGDLREKVATAINQYITG